MENQISIFTKLKKNNLSSVARQKGEVAFVLAFDDNGAFIKVTDKKGNSVNYDQYMYYSGVTRDILKTLARLQEKNAFKVDWENPENKVYLHEHEYIFNQLAGLDDLFDENKKKITFSADHGHIVLIIKELSSQQLTSSVQFFIDSKYADFKLLSESHILSDNTIYTVLPAGEAFKRIPVFTTTFSAQQLEQFLTLFYSCFDNIILEYKDYRCTKGEPVQEVPALIIEDIGEDNTLYLRTGNVVKGFPVEFMDNYDVVRVVTENELERTFVIHEISHSSRNLNQSDLQHLLKKCQKDIKAKEKSNYYPEGNLYVIEEALAHNFIVTYLPLLLRDYMVFGADKLRKYKIVSSRPKLSLQLSYGIDFFEGDAKLFIEGESFSLFEVISQYRKSAYIQLNDGTKALIDDGYLKKLERLFKKDKKKVKISFFDMPFLDELIDERIASEELNKPREIFEGFNKIQASILKLPKLGITLRDYQKRGVKWLRYLHQNSLGGCLADDMGLGKTAQAITLLSLVYPKEKSPSMIVLPQTLLFNWENELKKVNQELTYKLYYGPQRNLDEALNHQLLITTYATLRNDIEKLKDIKFAYVILDESQHIKNIHSQTAKAVMLLNSKHRLAISGTPVENNLGELYSLFRFLNPSMFGSLNDFNDLYAVPIQKDNNKDVMHELKRKIYPFIMRRLKKEVATELPEKIEQILYVEMSEQQKKLYAERLSYFTQSINAQIVKNGVNRSQFFILQALTELRRIASTPEAFSDGRIVSPKRDLLVENILDAALNGHKVLVFAGFINALENIADDLDRHSISYVFMTGETKNRRELVDRFQNDQETKVFLMTLKTGGVGINLTAADHVFIYDPWWNNSAENQAIDRTHRIGQDKTVFSYKLITRGTIEEKILILQEKKNEIFQQLISSDAGSLKSLSQEDIDFIFTRES
ncbi:MAG TPA: helicase SNF [Candidatus Margulisbacteria bacterium]|nr:helicase SNF [Candidatus Margulisiibacteriota bacterium]